MRILLCTDGSAHGQVALRFGAVLARGSSEPATLLGVLEHSSDEGRIAQALEEGKRWLEGAPSPESKIRRGHAAEEILDEAAEGEYAMIVLGARGKRGITRFLLGSTSERVARHARQPVLIVQGKRERLARVLACTGGREPGLAAVDLSGRVAKMTGAEVTVLHVMSQLAATPVLPEAGPLKVMPQAPRPPDTARVHLDDLEAQAEELMAQGTREGRHLREALDILDNQGVPAAARVRHGLVVDEIVGEAAEGDYDLVVIGVQTAAGWMRFLLDDIGHQILCCLNRPILVSKA
jgi:nucleotide-binding universal stress UspA family protein